MKREDVEFMLTLLVLFLISAVIICYALNLIPFFLLTVSLFTAVVLIFRAKHNIGDKI